MSWRDPLYGYSDMIEQPDGSYRYVRADIGQSPMGQAKLLLREFEDGVQQGRIQFQQDDHWAMALAGNLRAVLAESDKRLFASMPWYDKLIRKYRRRKQSS
jgi:hypothetical protein